MLRRSLRSTGGPAGRVSDHSESRDLNSPLPTVIGKRRRSLSPPVAPSTLELSTPTSEVSPKPLEISHPRVKRTRKAARSSDTKSGATPTVRGKRRRSLNFRTVPATINSESSIPVSEASPKRRKISLPRVKRTKATARLSDNTTGDTLPIVPAKRCRSPSPSTTPIILNPETSTLVSNALPTQLEVVSRPQAKRTRMTVRGSNNSNTGGSLPTVPRKHSAPVLSSTISEASPKPLEVSQPRVKRTRINVRALSSTNTCGAVPTIGKRRRSSSPPTAPSATNPELSTSVSEPLPRPLEVVARPQTKHIKTTSSTPISFAQSIHIEHEEPVAVVVPVTSSAGSQSLSLQSDAPFQIITAIEPVTGSHHDPIGPPLSTPIPHSIAAEGTESIDTTTPIGSTTGLSLLSLPLTESVALSPTFEHKEAGDALAPITVSAEANSAKEPITAIVAVASSAVPVPAGQPLIPEHKTIATIAPVASLSGSPHISQPLLLSAAYPQTGGQQERVVPLIGHSKIEIIPNSPAPGSPVGPFATAIVATASSTVSHPVDQPSPSSNILSHVIGQQSQVNAITSDTLSPESHPGSHPVGSCIPLSTAHSRTVEPDEFTTAIVPLSSSTLSHPSNQSLPSSSVHSQTAEYEHASSEPVTSDQSHNSLTGSVPSSKKRSRSSSLPDNMNLSPTLRPIIPTPRSPTKRTRLEDTEPLPLQPPVSVNPSLNCRRFGLATRRTIRNHSAIILQETMLARVKRSQVAATGSPTTGSPFYQNPVNHPPVNHITILGNDNGPPQGTNGISATTDGEQQEHNSPEINENEDNSTNLADFSLPSNGPPQRQPESLSRLPLSISPSQLSIPVASTLLMYPDQLPHPDEHLQANEPFVPTALPLPPFSVQPTQSTQCVQDLAITSLDPLPSSQGSLAITSLSSVCLAQPTQPAQNFLAPTTASPSPSMQPVEDLSDLPTTPVDLSPDPSPLSRPSVLVTSSSSTIPTQSTQPAQPLLASSTMASLSQSMKPVEPLPDLATTLVDPSPSSWPSVPATSSSSPIPTQSMQPTQPFQASSTTATITSLSSVHPAQQATAPLFNPIGSHERQKTNITKAMENLHKMPGTMEIGIPVNASSSNLTSDISEDDNDIYMADHSDSDNIDMANCSDDDDIYMPDHSDHDEHVDHGSSRKQKEKQRSMLVNRDAYKTYESLMRNPDAPCNNAAVATVIEMFVDLKSDLKTVLRSATSRANISQSGNSAGENRRGKAPPKVTFEVRHQDKFNLDLQHDVRVLAKELLGLPEVPLRVPTVQELRQFAKKDHGVIGPQIQNFVLDLDSTGLASPWNKRATSIFSSEFLNREDFSCRDRDAIEHAFKIHLKALRTQYKRQANAVTMDEAERIAQLDNTKRGIRYARRTYKRHRRCNSMNRFAHIPGVDKIIEELQQLPVDAMSGDETEYDNDGNAYLVKTRCEWRDKEADNLFEICDSLDLSTRFDSDDRPGRGRFPDIRTSSGHPDARQAPPRLPKNLYNAAYKDDLTADQEIKLAMRPAFKFLIPVELLRIAEKYRGAKSRKMAPLPSNHPRLALYTKDGTALL